MARVLRALAVSIALVAALVNAQMPPNDAYCTSTTTSSGAVPVIIINNGFMTLYKDASSSGNCVRLGSYGVDAYGNVTFNELDYASACYGSDLKVSSMTYNNVTNKFVSIVQNSYFDSTTYNFTFSPCTPLAGTTVTSGGGMLATGTYCGAWNETIVAHNKAIVLVSGKCASTYNSGISSSGFNSGVYATACLDGTASPSTSANYLTYDTTNQVIGISYASRWGGGAYGATNTFNFMNCVTSEDASPLINSPYCVDSMASSPLWRGASFIRTNPTTFVLTLPYSYYTQMCILIGRMATRGQSVALSFDTYNGSCALGSFYTPRLLSANFSLNANAFTFGDQLGNIFNAATCPAPVVPNGLYCAGWGAQLIVANQTFLMTGDASGVAGSCIINGVYQPWEGNSATSITNIQYTTCQPTIKSMTTVNNTIYIVYRRQDFYPYPVEGYAFRMDSCANGTKPAANTTAVPTGDYCLGSAGEYGALHVGANGTFSWAMNNSWVPSAATAPCTYVGTMNQRGGQVSYQVTTSGCNGYDLVYNTPQWIRDVTFMDGQIGFTKQNSTANVTAGSNTCPAANASVLPQSWYCSRFGGSMYVSADKVFYTAPGGTCFRQYTVTAINNGSLTLKLESYPYYSSGSCMLGTSSQITVWTLPSGDLYIAQKYLSSSSNPQSFVLSSSACGVQNYVPPAAATTSYCGSVPDAGYSTQVSMIVDPVIGMGVITIASSRYTNSPCVGIFLSNMYNSDMDMTFQPSQSQYCTSYWIVGQLTKDANGALTMFLSPNDGSNTMLNVTLAADSCTSVGVTNGHYCGSTMSPLATVSMQDVYVWGSMIVFGSMDGRTVVANFTLVGTNITLNTNQLWSWGQSGGFYTYIPATYVNVVGTRGLSVSSTTQTTSGSGYVPFTEGVSLDSCPGNVTGNYSFATQVLSSGTVTELNGAITAYFTQQGTFAMLMPNNQTEVLQRCLISGVYYVQSNQLTLVTTRRVNCNFVFEFSSVTQAADGAITMNVWYPWNTSVTVTLNTAKCGPVSTIPGGIYCDTGMSAGVCNGDVIYYSASGPGSGWTFGNVTTNTNGTMAAYQYVTGGSLSSTLLSYDTTSGIATAFDYFGKSLGYSSKSWCGTLESDVAYPTVGAYCGSSSVDGSNATLFVLPGGEFTLNYWPPVAAGTTTRASCTVIGGLYYSIATNLVSFGLQEWNSNCYFGGSLSYYAPPRVRFTSATINNATGAIIFSGESWTSTSSAATAIKVTFGPQCASRNDQSALSTPYYTRGQYSQWGGGLQGTMIVAGNMYALGIWRFGDVAVATGTYTPQTRMDALTDAGFGSSFVDYYGFYSGTVYNDTYSTKNVVQLTTRFSSGQTPITGSTGGLTYMVTPLGYSGATPADVAYNGASPNGYLDNKSDDKSKTGIIVGVIIAIVVVIAIVAFIVVRSNSSRGSSSDQQAGQDYRPMNGV